MSILRGQSHNTHPGHGQEMTSSLEAEQYLAAVIAASPQSSQVSSTNHSSAFESSNQSQLIISISILHPIPGEIRRRVEHERQQHQCQQSG